MDNVFELANLKRRLRELEEYNDNLEDRLGELEDATLKLQENTSAPIQIQKQTVIEKSKD